jgi:putative transposon-encoded protein
MAVRSAKEQVCGSFVSPIGGVSTDQIKYIQRIYIDMANRFQIDGEEVLDGQVKEFGNSAHVTVPKRWRGADVKVVRTSEPTEQDEE